MLQEELDRAGFLAAYKQTGKLEYLVIVGWGKPRLFSFGHGKR
jgi:hypothetical protein